MENGLRAGDLVRFEIADETESRNTMMVIGQILGHEADQIVVKERWAAHSLWGESHGAADTIHHVGLEDLRLYAKATDDVNAGYEKFWRDHSPA